MVEKDRTHITLVPEQNLAARLFSDLGLTVPVDMESVFFQYADVEIDHIPGSFEALLVRKPKGRTRPLLITSFGSTANTRYRFTLAHELGHMMLPWQTGAMLCHASITYVVSEPIVRQMEAEANRFAAEFLVPHAWATEQLKDASGPVAERICNMSRDAKVSAEVALLASQRVLPADMMLLLTDASGEISMTATSNGSMFPSMPEHGQVVDEGKLERSGALSKAKIGSRTVYVLNCSAAAVGEIFTHEIGGLSVDIIANILGEVEADESARKALLYSVNGIVGYANNLVKNTKDESVILAALRKRFIRFEERQDLAETISHHRFQAYLSAKARELAAKRG
jgi:hypothetical protein